MPSIEQARAWYTAADAVHDFDHILRVLRTAERLAREEGADWEIVQAAVLLHDAEGSALGVENGGERAAHHHRSASFAAAELRAEGWPEERVAAVAHCIRAHRYRDRSEPPATTEARVLFDADKLDVLGAIGVARVIAYAALDGQPFFAPPSRRFLETGQEEPGEPHSAYHEFLFKLRRVRERLFTRSARQMAEERTAYLEQYFARLQAEVNGEL